MYLKLKKNNFVLKQPTGNFFSYFANGERMLLEINKTAFDILLCLDGEYTLQDIIEYLADKYDEEYDCVKRLVSEFLINLSDYKLLEECDIKQKMKISRGSHTVYTPDFVTLDLTHNCPLKCKHCYVNAGIGDSMAPEFSRSLLLESINQGVTTFQLTGGEPFTYPYLKDLLKIMIENQVSIRIATSGYILTKYTMECMNILSDFEDVHIQVSVDGLEQTHNQIRGKKDSFDKTMKFIDICLERKLSVVIATSLINQSIAELKNLTKMLKEKGVIQQRFGLISNQGRAKDSTIERYNYEEFIQTISLLKKHYSNEIFSIEEIENKNIDQVDCGAGYKTIKITPNALVTPCAMMSYNIGNLNRETLLVVLKRATDNFMKLSSPNKSKCHGCSNENYCNRCISEALIRKDYIENCEWYESQKSILNECKVVIV